MEKLWAPWRIRYIQSARKPKKCIFCTACRKPVKNSFVVFKTDFSLSLLNIFPYNNGHMMVAPQRHINDLSCLSESEQLDLFACLLRTKRILTKVLRPDGFNIGVNLSESAGAGIPGHLHIHIVPRWKGDTNFMPVVAQTKIISQSLSELYRLLKDAYAKSD